MKGALAALCLGVLAVMVYLTAAASLNEDVVSALLRLWPDPWFRATLADTYFAFLFFWLWLAWREGWGAASLVWLVLILLLGNLAMACYLLLQLRDMRGTDGIGALFRRKGEPR